MRQRNLCHRMHSYIFYGLPLNSSHHPLFEITNSNCRPNASGEALQACFSKQVSYTWIYYNVCLYRDYPGIKQKQNPYKLGSSESWDCLDWALSAYPLPLPATHSLGDTTRKPGKSIKATGSPYSSKDKRRSGAPPSRATVQGPVVGKKAELLLAPGRKELLVPRGEPLHGGTLTLLREGAASALQLCVVLGGLLHPADHRGPEGNCTGGLMDPRWPVNIWGCLWWRTVKEWLFVRPLLCQRPRRAERAVSSTTYWLGTTLDMSTAWPLGGPRGKKYEQVKKNHTCLKGLSNKGRKP